MLSQSFPELFKLPSSFPPGETSNLKLEACLALIANSRCENITRPHLGTGADSAGQRATPPSRLANVLTCAGAHESAQTQHAQKCASPAIPKSRFGEQENSQNTSVCKKENKPSTLTETSCGWLRHLALRISSLAQKHTWAHRRNTRRAFRSFFELPRAFRSLLNSPEISGPSFQNQAWKSGWFFLSVYIFKGRLLVPNPLGCYQDCYLVFDGLDFLFFRDAVLGSSGRGVESAL